MTPRRNRQFTLLLLDDQDRVRRLRFTERTLRFGLAMLGGLALLFLLLVFYYVGARFTIRSLELQLHGPAASAATAAPASAGAGVDDALLEKSHADQTGLVADRYYHAAHWSWMSAPARWPLRGWVTSEFGLRVNPLTAAPEMHTGVDIAVPVGTAVVATAPGRVVFVGEDPAYGLVAVIAHGQGYTSFLGHLDRAVVVAGQEVQEGDIIGRSGNTGQSSGPHLHYELRRFGIPVDPRPFLPEMGQAAAAPAPPPAAAPSTEQTPAADSATPAAATPPPMVEVPSLVPTAEPNTVYGD
ncbi:MAG: M23 family metallopeptidase [Myxococcales bacterium]|nr:M23 family metallopeptidase [Myxococcales bacterium]